MLWLRGYVIFENKKIIFFNLKIKLLYRNYFQAYFDGAEKNEPINKQLTG